MAVGVNGALPLSTQDLPQVHCSSCGSPTSITSAPTTANTLDDQVVIMVSKEPTSGGAQLYHRDRMPLSPDVNCRGHCRKCHAELPNIDTETPKIGRREYGGSSRRDPRIARRVRKCALTVWLPLLLLHVLVCAVLRARESVLRWEPKADGPAAGSAGGIPRIIHQMYKTEVLPAKWAHAREAWEVHHPRSEYQYMLWTDQSLRALIEADYPWLLPTYDAYPYPTQRWDASRYALLHKYGGLYADLDLHPVASVGPLLRGHTLLLPYTPNVGLTNAFMAATAGHPFLEFAMRMLPEYAHRWYHLMKHNTILSSTGSTFIWAMHMRWAREHSQPAMVGALVAAEDWGKCSYCESTAREPAMPQADEPAAAEVPVAQAVAAEAAEAAHAHDAETAARATTSTGQDGSAEGGAADVAVAGGEASEAAGGGVSARALGQAALVSTAPPASRVGVTATRSAGKWSSPFAHLQGSSWHSGDSVLVLLLFCHLNELVVVCAIMLVWRRWRSRKLTAVVSLGLLAEMCVRRACGIVLVQELLGRPWIWLIMS